MRRKASPRAVVTVTGYTIPGDSDDRPGDPIMSPWGSLETVAKVLPPNEAVTDDDDRFIQGEFRLDA